MQSIIEKIATKAIGLDFTTSGNGRNNEGLAKIADLKGLSSLHINLIMGTYLDDIRCLNDLRGYLLSRLDENSDNALNAVKGSLIAYQTNAYRVVMCYKCQGKGCDRCGGTGKTSKKPKAHELCGVNRNTWHNKSFKKYREIYNSTYDHLIKLEAEINQIYYQKPKQNKS